MGALTVEKESKINAEDGNMYGTWHIPSIFALPLRYPRLTLTVVCSYMYVSLRLDYGGLGHLCSAQICTFSLLYQYPKKNYISFDR